MNLKQRLQDLINKQKALLDKAKAENRVFTNEEKTQFDAFQTEIESVKDMIAAEEKFAATNAAFTQQPDPQTPPAPRVEVKPDNSQPKLFANLADQLKCIKNHAMTGVADERLVKINNATGAAAGAGSDGGFAIQSDFAGTMVESAVQDDPFLSLLDTYPVSGNADRVKWNDLAETDISSTIWGGIQTYWAAEAATVAASKPQIQERELKLEKLMGFYYSTNELESDSTFNSQVVSRGFTASIRRNLLAAVLSGDGIGKPTGLLKSAALVSVAKEGGQAADTVVWKNIAKMYNRTLGDKSKYVWLIHPDVHEQLDNLDKVIGTGGVPIYLQAAAVGTVDTLKGRPVYDSDHCSALGDQGDILLVDPSQYLLAYKGGVEQASSIHVSFLTAENCFRFIFRVNGMPKRNAALTIKNSALTRSGIVTLDARA